MEGRKISLPSSPAGFLGETLSCFILHCPAAEGTSLCRYHGDDDDDDGETVKLRQGQSGIESSPSPRQSSDWENALDAVACNYVILPRYLS